MAAPMTFKVTVFQTNTDILPELAEKSKDLSILFEKIILEWAAGNPEKFGFGIGASLSGTPVDPQVEWKALSPAYFKAKSKQYPDRLMVRTGSLLASLSTPGQFFKMVMPEQAMFGTPNDPEDVMKMQYNWNTRQTVFLGDADQNMIRQLTSEHFTIQTRNIKEDIAEMNADFANTVG